MPSKKPIEKTVPAFLITTTINQMLFFWVFAQQAVLQCSQKESIFAFYKFYRISEDVLPYQSATVQVAKMRKLYNDAKFAEKRGLTNKNAFFLQLANRVYYCNKTVFCDAQNSLLPTLTPENQYFQEFGWLV